MLVLCPVLGSRFVIVIELCYCIRAGKAERRTKMEAVGGGVGGGGGGEGEEYSYLQRRIFCQLK